ncbi:MAG: hypothetical protein RLZZ40_219 [Actinomycetota bacterium]
MIAFLAQYERCAGARRRDVFDEVGLIDGVPEPERDTCCLVVRQCSVTVEVRVFAGERRRLELQEPFDVPLANVLGVCIDVNSKIEKIRQGEFLTCGWRLQNVEPLDDEDVGSRHDDPFVLEDVVRQV